MWSVRRRPVPKRLVHGGFGDGIDEAERENTIRIAAQPTCERFETECWLRGIKDNG
jgi:hypothetical protein